ncbi:glycosyltransferase family 2 protein [Draconibacterium sp. IB214405]|uniref:glycosyltransferase family 2 protein n=1 Tax=Draconibacterium sp. IB214405 TaxID=3097352 RepID=UPI002A0ED364|nr:glycosyltransferase family 2 protein [Draconibacterium sp. IB214405]MDX8340536.1 glycosyltransferase family 2 protein [Draconibacterium sp. IB214405]
MILSVFFWVFLFILFYTYLGYALVLWFFVGVKKLFKPLKASTENRDFEPEVCLFVTAYNEKDYIEQKVNNAFSLDYPKEKIQYLWVTDGSNDGSQEILKGIDPLEVYHQSERRGKMHAMNRGMSYVKAPIVIFSDSNTILGKNSIREIVDCFKDPTVGCVAGEKRIIQHDEEAAAGAGEGLYWKFESWVKRKDWELNSAVGAVGELFAVRTELFEDVETDTLLDDFIISLRIAQRGYKIAYAPNAYAEETASLNVKEELKRKVRIAAGGIQTILRLKGLLNPFKNGILTWQYFSHKVLRWAFAPPALIFLFIVNLLIVQTNNSWGDTGFYTIMLYLQLICYLAAAFGWYFENRKVRLKVLFVPYYFVMINYASILGMVRYVKGRQSVNWEKSKRAG